MGSNGVYRDYEGIFFEFVVEESAASKSELTIMIDDVRDLVRENFGKDSAAWFPQTIGPDSRKDSLN